MIPKKIHYCWFGKNPLPKLARKCIQSWKKHCPDYEIIEWNEDNFDLNLNEYTKLCYNHKKYAFLTDYIRLIVVEKEGGIYFDTDVEVVKSFDDLLNCKSFWGFENNDFVASGLGFGSEAGNEIVRQMLFEYDDLIAKGRTIVNCPVLNTAALVKFGLRKDGKFQIVKDGVVYPQDYFNPMNSATGKITRTKNTYSIHRYTMSALTPLKRIRSRIMRPIHRVFGVNFFKCHK